MSSAYDPIAEQYKRFKSSPFCVHVEAHSYLGLIGDVTGLSVLDLACGDGLYTRQLKRRGASRVVGVDVSEKMIELAVEEEARAPLGVEYLVRSAQSLGTIGSFDLAVASFLLHYAPTREDMLAMCRSVHRNLKPGGRFVALNDNFEQPVELYGASRKYGFVKSISAPVREEGTSITFTLWIGDETLRFDIYHHEKATYEWALRSAGFTGLRWLKQSVSPEGTRDLGADHWLEAIQHQPFVMLECRKEGP